MMFKKLYLASVCAGMTLSTLFAGAPDGISELTAQITALRGRHAEVEARDPLLAAWLTQQYAILTRLADYIGADLAGGRNERADSEKKDFALMLKRLGEELDFSRTAPDLTAQGYLNVKDFGAKGDGVTDDTLAIRAAVNAALAGKVRAVRLPAGRYLVKNHPLPDAVGAQWAPPVKVFDDYHPGDTGGIVIHGQNLLLTGEAGTEILVADPQSTAIHIINSDNVRVSNLRISYAQPSSTNGTIIAFAGDSEIDVQLEPGAADPRQSYFRERGFKGLMRFYSEGRQPDGRRPEFSNDAIHQIAPDVTWVRDNIFRFKFKSALPVQKTYRVGQHVTYYARSYTDHAVFNYGSRRTRFDRLVLTGSPAIAFANFNSEMPFITNCLVDANPERYTSTAADALFFKSGWGGYIAGNTFRNVGDDCFNIHVRLSPILRQEGNVLYLPLKIWPEKYWRNATRMGYVLASRGETNEHSVDIVKFEPVVEPSGTVVKVTLAGPLPPLTTVVGLGAKQKPDVISLPDYEWHGLVIAGNHFEHGVSRLLAGGKNINIIDNVFLDSLNSHTLVVAGMESVNTAGGEGRFIRNLCFSGNRFHSKAKTIFSFTSHINPWVAPAKTSYNAEHALIENNLIELYGDSDLPVFRLENVDDLVIRHNRMTAAGRMSGPVFSLSNCIDVRLTDNQISGTLATVDAEVRK